MRDDIDNAALLKVLRRCRDLVASSEDSDWSCMDARCILERLKHYIDQLETASSVDLDELTFLFVVTGPLQETSMSNGWAMEYLVLAERFDEIIGEPS